MGPQVWQQHGILTTKSQQLRMIMIKNIQDEHMKAFKTYYTDLLKKQQELEEAVEKQELSNIRIPIDPSSSASHHIVGKKSKCGEDKEDDGTEWASITGNASENYKVCDLKVQADALANNEDGLDWQED